MAAACALRFPGHARANCVPVSAVFCAGVDDYADAWINGTCIIAACPSVPPGIFQYSMVSAACVTVSTSILSPTGANAVAVEVYNVAVTKMWGTWALTIYCADGTTNEITSGLDYDMYHDPLGTSPPPVNGGASPDWYDPLYTEGPGWGAPSYVTVPVNGAKALDSATGLPLTPVSWDANGDGLNIGEMLYFRQNLPTPTPTFSITPTYSYSPTYTVSPTVTPTFTISPTFTVSPTITQTLTPVNYSALLSNLGVYPNPFSDQVQIGFNLQLASQVKLTAFNVAGELVYTQTQTLAPGVGIWPWRGVNSYGARCASGVYILRMAMVGSPYTDGFWTQVAIIR